MSKPQYFSIKGNWYARLWGTSDPFRSMGNTPAAQLSFTRETESLMSTGNVKGKLAEEETSRDASLTITFNEMGKEMLKLYVYGATKDVSAVTSAAFTLPTLKAGEVYFLPHVNVSNVVLDTLVEGVDYDVSATGGQITARKDIVAPSTDGTYDASTSARVGIFATDGVALELMFISENSGKRINLYKWQPNPADTLDVVSTTIAAPKLSGPLLADDTARPDPELGNFGVIHDALAGS